MGLFGTYFRLTCFVLAGFLTGCLFNSLLYHLLIKKENFCANDHSRYPSQNSDNSRNNIEESTSTIVTKILKPANGDFDRRKAKFDRPRFYAQELGVKDKLLVVVLLKNNELANDQLLIKAINQTSSHHVNKLIYLNLSDRHLVNKFAHKSENSVKNIKLLAALDYVSQKFVQKYDWILLVDQFTYVKSFRLYEFVSHLSPGHKVLLGNYNDDQQQSDVKVCSFEQGGLLISDGAALKMRDGLKKCQVSNMAANFSADYILSLCLAQMNLACTEKWKGKSFKTIPFSDSVTNESNFFVANQALTVYRVPGGREMYTLHQHFCQLELKQIDQSLVDLEQEIYDKAAQKELGWKAGSFQWPAGLPPSQKPRNRFELVPWDYFTFDQQNRKLIFETANARNVRLLGDDEEREIWHALNVTLHQLQRQQDDDKKWELSNFVGGYRRFDPNRGLDYLLDVEFMEPSTGKKLEKRYRLVKPLSKVETVPAPYADETPPIHLILASKVPSVSNELSHLFDHLSDFLTHLEKCCMKEQSGGGEQQQVVHLDILLGHQSPNAAPFFQPIEERLEILVRKYSNVKLNLTQSVLESTKSIFLLAFEQLGRKFNGQELVLWLDSRTRLDAEFLKRVKLNTLAGHQVFCPVPFVRYRIPPMTVAAPQEFPRISKYFGRFDDREFSLCSFYWSDFRSAILSNPDTYSAHLVNVKDTVDLFLDFANGRLRILRYPDPDLVVDYSEKYCPIYDATDDVDHFGESEYDYCISRNKELFAPKSHYANMIQKF